MNKITGFVVFLTLLSCNAFAADEKTLRTVKTATSVPKVSSVKTLPEAKPGIRNVYKMVRAKEGPYKGERALELGFSNYFKLGKMDEFQEGDLIYAAPPDHSKKGLASTYQFKRVLPLSTREQVHIALDKDPIYGDDSSLHTYEAYVTKVIDGDTFKAVLDLGFGITTEQKLRLKGIDAPEVETEKGMAAKTFLEENLGSHVVVRAVRVDKYGRYLADVFVNDNYLNQKLLDEDLAVRSEE